MPRPAKTLLDHAHDASFIPSRHAELLATDDSIAKLRFTDEELDHAPAEYWRRLFDLQLWYQHKADTQAEKAETALAFRDAIALNYDRYRQRFLRDGRRLVWAGSPAELFECECAACEQRQAIILSLSPWLGRG